MVRASILFFALSGFRFSGSPIPAGLLNHALAFEPNRGQAAPSVRFVARGNSHDYLLSGPGVTVSSASLSFSGANVEKLVMAQEPLGKRTIISTGQ